MIKIKYSNSNNFELENIYFKQLILNKFSKPNSRATNQTILEINSDNGFNKRKKISILRIYNLYLLQDIEFQKVFNGIKLYDLLLAKPNEIINLITKIGEINSKHSLYKKITDIFNYSNKFQKDTITPFFKDNFKFRTCFYCNKDFITNFEKQDDKLISTFQLDHFYDKGKYPYLALSFYNLIPSCSVCNSTTVKGSIDCFKEDKIGKFKNEVCLAPNNSNFNFHQKVKFKLFLSDTCKSFHIKDKKAIQIPLKENYSNEYSKYIEVFKLNERYDVHKDIVYEMIQNAERYPESRLKELETLTGIPYQQIKKDIFNLIEEDDDLSKKPFSKLIKDISEELKLI